MSLKEKTLGQHRRSFLSFFPCWKKHTQSLSPQCQQLPKGLKAQYNVPRRLEEYLGVQHYSPAPVR